MADKELLVSVTRNDCQWSYTRGTGAGGQKRNKTSSAVHVFHEPSGARGYSEAGRSQLHNRQDAFRKMVNTREFQRWLKIESARKMGLAYDAEKIISEQMQEKNLRIEGKVDGKWVRIEDAIQD